MKIEYCPNVEMVEYRSLATGDLYAYYGSPSSVVYMKMDKGAVALSNGGAFLGNAEPRGCDKVYRVDGTLVVKLAINK